MSHRVKVEPGIFRRGKRLQVVYSHRGREHRESVKSDSLAKARSLLKKRLGEIGRGRLIGPSEERVTFAALAHEFLADYEIRGLRSLNTAKGRVAHLTRFFGLDRALDITTDRIRAYQRQRLHAEASAATVNRELAALSRMFSLAVKAGRLSLKPVFPARPDERTPRQGFFEHSEFLALRAHLPPEGQDLLDFAYFSGWRRGEITALTWAEVDLPGDVVRLDPARSKSKVGRLLPLSPPIREVLERRRVLRRLDTPLVFHRDGAPIMGFRKSWASACRRAGLTGKLFHDLRRTAIRNLVRSGTPERVAMSLSGHKTRSVFDRYNITSEEDLRQATTRLAEYVEDQPRTPTVVPFSRRVTERQA